jgi:hypothetical protein
MEPLETTRLHGKQVRGRRGGMVESGRRGNFPLEFLDSADHLTKFGHRSHDHSGHPVVSLPKASDIAADGLRARVPGTADARSESGRSKNIRACRRQSREREESLPVLRTPPITNVVSVTYGADRLASIRGLYLSEASRLPCYRRGSRRNGERCGWRSARGWGFHPYYLIAFVPLRLSRISPILPYTKE